MTPEATPRERQDMSDADAVWEWLAREHPDKYAALGAAALRVSKEPRSDRPYFAGGEPQSASSSGIHRDAVLRGRSEPRSEPDLPREAGDDVEDWQKLIVLAAWFDMWDRPETDRQAILDDPRNPGRNDVQRDLRRIAAALRSPSDPLRSASRTVGELDAAWAEAEAALPEHDVIKRLERRETGEWDVWTGVPDPYSPTADYGYGPGKGDGGWGGDWAKGETPAAALRALAAHLTQSTGDPTPESAH
jgi:hypothetical protein